MRNRTPAGYASISKLPNRGLRFTQLLGGDMLFEWVWKNRTTADEKMLDIMERMAKAAEQQARAVEASHQATIASAMSAKDANEAAARKYAAEQELVEQEIERRKRFDAGVLSN